MGGWVIYRGGAPSPRASPGGAGIVASKVGVPVQQELWRRGDFRGVHTALLNPAEAALHERNLEEEIDEIQRQHRKRRREEETLHLRATTTTTVSARAQGVS